MNAARKKKKKLLKNYLDKNENHQFSPFHISSSYAKILGETNFHTWKILRSGSKAGERD